MWKDFVYSSNITGTGGYGPVDILKSAGVSAGAANLLPATVGLAAGLGMSYLCRSGSLLELFGMLSAIARLWAYHRHYDNVTVMFLLVALGRRAIMREDYFSLPAFIAVGLSLWMPAKATELALFRGFQMAAWTVGAIVLFIKAKNPGPACRPADRRPDDTARGNQPRSMNSSDSLSHP